MIRTFCPVLTRWRIVSASLGSDAAPAAALFCCTAPADALGESGGGDRAYVINEHDGWIEMDAQWLPVGGRLENLPDDTSDPVAFLETRSRRDRIRGERRHGDTVVLEERHELHGCNSQEVAVMSRER